MLLLADEPTGNLDTKSADEVFALLRRFNSEHGTTVRLVTHNVVMSQRRDLTIEVVDGQVTDPLTLDVNGQVSGS